MIRSAMRWMLVVAVVAAAVPTFAATYTTSQSGNWSSASTWGGSGVPGAGDTATVNHSITLDVSPTVSILTLNNSVSGAQTLTATSILQWNGGTVSGGCNLTVPNGATATLLGYPSLSSSTLTIASGGTFNLTSSYYVYLSGSASVVNNGTVNFQGDNGFYLNGGGTQSIVNNATIEKTGGTGNGAIQVALTANSGSQLLIQSGTLQLGDVTSTASTLSVSSGATAQFYYTTTSSFDASSTISGAGNVTFSSGTSTISGTYNVTGATTSSSGTNTINSPASLGTLTVSGGTLTLNAASQLTVPSLAMNGGTLNGTAPLTFTSSAVTWTGGTIGGSGALTIPVSSTVTMSGYVSFDTRSIINYGNLTYTSNYYSYFVNTASLTNNGTITFQGDNGFYPNGSGSQYLANNGTIQKTGGTGFGAIQIPITALSGSQILIQSGALQFGNITSTASTLSVSSGATAQFYWTTAANFDAASTITGAGSVQFASGSNTINAAYNVTGTTSETSGTTTLGTSVTSLGNVSTSGGTLTISASSAPSIGNITVSGGTLTLNIPTTLSIPVLTISGGTLNGTASISLTGSSMTWSGGTIGGSGTLTIPNGTTISANGYFNIDTRAVTNNGAMTYSSNYYSYFLNSGSLTNNGTITFQGDNGFYISGSGSQAVINNGTIQKTGGSGSGGIQVALTANSGSQLLVQSGTLQLGNVTSTGSTLSVSSGATVQFYWTTTASFDAVSTISGAGTVQFSAGTNTINAAYNVSGATSGTGGITALGTSVTSLGNISNSGGTLTIAASSGPSLGNISVSGGTLTLNIPTTLSIPFLTMSGGTLNGTASISLTGATMTWTGGTIGGSGTLTIPNGTAIAVNGYFNIDTRAVTNNGTITYSSSYYSYFLNSASLTNNGTITFQGDNGFYLNGSGSQSVINNGTIQKTGGSGSGAIQVPVTAHSGSQIGIQSGTLQFGDVTSTGASLSISSGATALFYWTTTSSFDAASSIAGAGTVQFANGTNTVNAAYNITGTTVSSGGTTNIGTSITSLGTITHTSGALTINNTSMPSVGSIALSGGTLTLNLPSTLTIPTLTITGGTLAGTAPITVTSAAMTWTNGTIAGTGTLTIPNGTTITISGYPTYDTRAIVNNGAFVYTSNYYSYFYNGASFTNNGTVTFQGDGGFYIANGSDSVVNNGTIQKTGGTGFGGIQVPLTANSGSQLLVQSGGFYLGNVTGTSTTLSIASGATAQFYYTTNSATFDAASTITGAGNVQFANGTNTIAAAYNVTGTTGSTGGNTTISNVTAITSLSIAGGTLTINSASPVNVATLAMTGGTFGGTAPINITGTTQTWGYGTFTGSGSISIPNGTTVTMNGGLYIDGRPVTNAGTVNYIGSAYTYMGNGASLANSGTIDFQNDNSIQLNTGLASINNSGTIKKSGGTGTGYLTVSLTAASGSQLLAQSGTIALGAVTATSATFNASSGAAFQFYTSDSRTFDASTSIGGSGDLTSSNGTTTINGTITLPLTVSGGTLNINSAAAQSIPTLTMSYGTLSGSANLALTGAASTWSGGTITGTGTFTIPAATTVTITGYPTYDSRQFINNGTIAYSGSTYSYLQNGATITNNGTLDFQSDASIYLSGSGSLTNNGTIKKSSGGLTSYLGMPVTNAAAGVIRPGTGTLTLSNGLTNAGTLYFALSGPSSYGVLNVPGSFALGGTLTAALANGYTPTAGASFPVLTFGSYTGAFAAKNLTYSGGTFTDTYGSTNVTLTAAAASCTSEPSGIVSWWRAEGNANDSIGTNNGTLVNSATTAAGQVGSAFSLNGTNQYVSVGDNASLHLSSYTVETWVRFNSNPGTASIIGKPYGSGTQDSIGLWLQGGYLLGGTNLSAPGSLAYPFSPTIGTWYHIALTYDGTSGATVLYLNGSAASTATMSTPALYDSNPFLIGADIDNGSYFSYFPGLIDEVTLYNRALTGSEITNIYNAGAAGKCYSAPTTRTTVAAGNWSSASTWSGGVVPSSLDTVSIGHNVTLDVDATVAAASFNNSSTLSGSAHTLTVTGTTTWDNATVGVQLVIPSGGSLVAQNVNGNHILDGGSITNSGTITLSSASLFTRNGGAITNAGGATITMAGDYDFRFDGNGAIATLTNNGTIQKTSGTGTSTVTFTLTNNSTISASTGTIALGGATSNASTGVINAAGGAAVTFSADGNTFASSSSFTGAGSITFTGASTFSGSIAAAGTFTLAASKVYTFSGTTFTGTMTVDNAFLTGALTIPAGSTLITQNVNGNHIADALTLANNGTVNISGVGAFYFRNGGGITNAAGANVILSGNVDFRYDGNGAPPALVNNGTITKTAGTGNSTLTFSPLTNNATIHNSAGAITFTSAYSGASTGVLTADSGTTFAFAADGNTFASGATYGGSGAYTFSGSATFNGTVTAAGAFTLSGAKVYTFNSSTFNGALTLDNAFLTGTLTIASGSALTTQNINGNHIGDGLTLTNNGTINVSGASLFFRNAGAVINAAGANVNLAGDYDFRFDGNGVAPVLTNNGTITKTAGGGTSIVALGTMTNNSTIHAATGTISFNSVYAGAASSTLTADSGTTFLFTIDGNTFASGASYSGSGAYTFTGASTFDGGVTAAGAFTLAASKTYTFNATTFNGTLTVDNAFMTGALTIASGSTLALQNVNGTHIADALTLTNNGTVTIQSAGLFFRNSGSFTNASGANVNINGDLDFRFDGNGAAPTMTNNGAITKTGGAGNTSLGIGAMTNNATIRAAIGTVTLSTLLNGAASSTLTADPGAAIAVTYDGNTFASGASFSGTGSFTFSGSSTFNGNINSTTASFLLGGSKVYTFNTTFTGALTVDNAFLTGTLTIPAGGVLMTQNVNGNHIGDGLTLSNSGTINLPSTSFFFRNGGSFSNAANGTLNIGGDFDFRWDGNGAPPSFALNGTLTKTGGSSTSTVSNGGTITNAGNVFASVGTISFPNGLTNSGTLGVAINGATAGSGYGRIAVTGAANLGGTITATVPGAYQPLSGDQFTVVTAGSLGGAFQNSTIPFGTGRSFTVGTSGTNVVLTANGNPTFTSDLATSISASSSALASGTAFTASLTTTNNGPDDATGVTTTVTVTNGTITGATGACSVSNSTTATCNIGSLLNGASATATINVTSGSAGTTSLTATVTSSGSDPNSSNNSATANVSVCSAPATSLTLPSSVCPNGTAGASVPGNANATFTWTLTNATITSGQGTSAITFTAGSSGSVGVSVTGSDSVCTSSNSGSVPISTPAAPSISASGSTTICAGGSVTLSANAPGATAYDWMLNGSSLGVNASTINVTAAGSYTVTATYGTCSATSAATTVTVNNPPTATITAPASVCASSTSNTASVNATAGATYSWSISNGNITGGAATSSITFTAPPSGSVTLSVTVTSNSCSTTTSTTVPVTVVTPSITGPSTICAGSSATLDAGAGFASYLWSPGGATTRTITVAPSSTTTYSVTVTSGSCSASASHAVNVTAVTTPTITAPASVCANTSANASTATVSGATYAWTIANGSITAGQGTNAITFSAGASGNVSLGVTVSNAASCGGSASTSVAISAPPDATITAPSSICANGSGSASVPPMAGATFVWTITGGSIATGQGTNAITFNAPSSGNAVLGVNVTNGACTASSSATVAVGLPPSVVINVPSTSCPNATVTASVPTVAGATYAWTLTGATIASGQGTSSITFTAPASGSVTINLTETAGGCTSTASMTTTVGALSVSITAPSSTAAGSTSNIATATNIAGATYAWTITNGTITSGQGTNAIRFTAGASGNVGISVTVTNGACTASKSASVTITAPQQTADLALSMAASSPSVAPNSAVAFTITVKNLGPNDATSVNVNTSLSAGTFVSATSSFFTCANTACSAAALPANASATITINVNAPSSGASLTATSSVSSATLDPVTSNNTAGASVTITQPSCGSAAPTPVSPADGASIPSPVTFTWSSVANATQYDVWTSADSAPFALLGSTASTTLTANVAGKSIEWYVAARFTADCPAVNSAHRSFTVNASGSCDNHLAPVLNSPLGTSTASPVTFSWQASPAAAGYKVWIAVDGAAAQDIGTTTTATTLTAAVPAGNITWFVDALFAGCPAVRSANGTFTVSKPDPCANRTATSPTAPADGSSHAASKVTFQWSSVANASGYRVWTAIDGAPFNALTTTTDLTADAIITAGHVEWYVETLFDGCSSVESAHRTFDVPRGSSCGNNAKATSLAPTTDTTKPSVTFTWSAAANATSYEVWLGLDSGVPSLLGTTNTTSLTHDVPPGALEWFVRANFDGCPATESAHATFSYVPPASCTSERPLLLAPAAGDTALYSPVSFSWKGVTGADSYKLYLSKNGAAFTVFASTSDTHLDNAAVPNGAIDWYVEASLPGCAPAGSATARFNVAAKPSGCPELTAPAIAVPSSTSSGVKYTLRWNRVAGAETYVVQSANNAAFNNASVASTADDHYDVTTANAGNTPITMYFRVRALATCQSQPGPYSTTTAVAILPSVSSGNQLTGALPADVAQNVNYTIPLDASLAGLAFTATPNQTFVTVTPSAGIVPAGGTTLNVAIDTSHLAIGTTSTGVTITTSVAATASAKTKPLASGSTSTTTVSVSLVTPVTVSSKSTPPPDALIIPAVAHADGVNSKFQSDVRVTNSAAQVMKYQVTFTPTGDAGGAAAKITTIDIDPGKTVALDDILGTWFANGAAAGSIGTLEIRPLTTQTVTGNALNVLNSLSTFASSRTFNVTANGTFGQYIPAIPFGSFVGLSKDPKVASILSLQQIAQSDAYRTNIGLVEGSGQPASVLVSVFGKDGSKVTDFPLTLNGGQHMQFALGSQNVGNLTDGRVEVKVLSPGGKVTAYASVLDNQTNDPLLVSPVNLSQAGNTKFVIPGVADLNNGLANWRTDMRLFNASSKPVDTTLTFYSQAGGDPKSVTMTLAPNEVKTLDNTLANTFGITNDGGAVHITTADPTNVIATARTYNQTSNGTYGQFIPAVTPTDAIGAGSRALQLLQLEESDRYRSNVGIAEVNGKPATVQISVIPADGRVTATATLELKPNEFRQLNAMLKSFNTGTSYNARVAIKVVGGEGRITAYASVIDQVTQDPTFVPAQ